MRNEAMHGAPLVRTHVLVGQPDRVRAALERARLDGRLVGVHAVTELADRQVQVTAELREGQPRTVRRLRGRLGWPARTWLRLAAAVLGVAAVAGVIWLIVAVAAALIAAITAAIGAVAAWLSAYWPALVGGAIALLLLGGTAGGVKCAGLHCGGFRHR